MQHAQQTGVAVWAWCLMPDHVHLVLSPSTDCDIITFVGQFKNLTLRRAWKMGFQGAFWQQGFWDHFGMRDGDLPRMLQYVLDNPVRAGLVERAEDYPFSGTRSQGV